MFSSTPGLGNKVRDVQSSFLKFGELLELLEVLFRAKEILKKMKNHTAIFLSKFFGVKFLIDYRKLGNNILNWCPNEN